MKNNTLNNQDYWLIAALEHSYKKAWRGIIFCAIALIILAACFLATLNVIFEWIAIIPACMAFFCMGYQGAMIKADNHIRDYASQVAVIIEAQLSAERKRKEDESIKSR